jgi:hypothetical protein
MAIGFSCSSLSIFSHQAAILTTVCKTIKYKATFLATMDHEVPNDLKDLIVQFVDTYSNVVDLELDQNLDPKLWLMPPKKHCCQERGCTLLLTRSIP